MGRKIALFGPPGVGKSTIVYLAQKRGIPALDLETIEEARNQRRKRAREFFNKHSHRIAILGTANLQISDLPDNVETILLLPHRRVYLKQLAHRDLLHPEKRGQNALRYYKGFRKHRYLFDRVFRGVIKRIRNPEKILDIILETERK